MPIPSALVYPDPDIDALRAAVPKLPEGDAKIAADMLSKYARGFDFSVAQWDLVRKLVARAAQPAQPTRPADARIETLRQHGALTFNASAAADFVARSDRGYRFSPAQDGFIAKLVASAEARLATQLAPIPAATKPSTTATEPSAAAAALPALCELLDRAAERLEWPSIKTDRFRAYRRKDGSVGFKLGGDQVGSLQRDGRLWLSPMLAGDTRTAIEALIEAPIYTVTVVGRRLVNCCFCGQKLDTNASKSAGYGPICASNYGLPWGDVDQGIVRGTFTAEEAHNHDGAPF